MHNRVLECKDKSLYALRVRKNIGGREFEPEFNVAVSVDIERRGRIEGKSNPIIGRIDGYRLGSPYLETPYLAFNRRMIGGRPDHFPIDVSDASVVVAQSHDFFPDPYGWSPTIFRGLDSCLKDWGCEVGRRSRKKDGAVFKRSG